MNVNKGTLVNKWNKRRWPERDNEPTTHESAKRDNLEAPRDSVEVWAAHLVILENMRQYEHSPYETSKARVRDKGRASTKPHKYTGQKCNSHTAVSYTRSMDSIRLKDNWCED